MALLKGPVIRTMTSFPDGIFIEYITEDDVKVGGLSATHVLFVPLAAYQDQIDNLFGVGVRLLQVAMDDFNNAESLNPEDDDD